MTSRFVMRSLFPPAAPLASVLTSLLGRAFVLAAPVLMLVVGAAAPAGAQYGTGGVELFVTPRVPISETFDVTGSGCAAGSIVEITIDGVSGVVATTTASAGGNYAISDIDLPDGLEAGTDQTVRATCGPDIATAIMTLLCHDGALPVDGDCEDGSDGLTGGVPPTTTTTTTTIDPGGTPAGGTGGDSSPGASGGSSGDSGEDLAFTGVAFGGILVQTGVTLFVAGFLLVVIARRREQATA